MSDDLDYEKRKQQRLRKLGTSKPKCSICGESHWECLELHHIGGQAYDQTLVILCRNCHRKVSIRQHGHPETASEREYEQTRLARLLLGLADLLALAVEKLRQIAREILGPNCNAAGA